MVVQKQESEGAKQMKIPSDPIQQMRQCINKLDASVAAELNGALDDVEKYVSQQYQETQRLSVSQSDAMVQSAEMTAELEETKESLATRSS